MVVQDVGWGGTWSRCCVGRSEVSNTDKDPDGLEAVWMKGKADIMMSVQRMGQLL